MPRQSSPQSPRPSSRQSSRRQTHPVDELLPLPRLALYGFQHVLAFYAAAVIVPVLLGNALGLSRQELVHLISADLLTCGVASIVQALGVWRIGARLPWSKASPSPRSRP